MHPIKQALIITSTTILATTLLGNIYASLKLKQMRAEAYRPTDRYSLGKRYESNVNVIETTKFGDLCALSGAQKQEQCIFSEGPRTALFQTDRRGWKTSEKLEKADFVIAGDSFLGALGGDSNRDQLGQQLYRLTGKRFYEAAHPGDPGDYLLRIHELYQERPLSQKYLLLIFEGNDLAINENSFPISIQPHPSDERPWLAATRHTLDRWIAQLKSPPLLKLLAIYLESYRIQINRTTHVKADASLILEINNKQHAFGINNGLTSIDKNLSLPLSIHPNHLGYLKTKIKCIIFVPTKNSTYLSSQPLKERHPFLVKDFQQLNAAGIATLDLTPALRQKASIKTQNPLWWRDDTHWNKYGIKTAADAIVSDKQCLR
ncbi:MAG: alginate O-acetyltransferase AlgX-related protein [Vulcanococcus sp.]